MPNPREIAKSKNRSDRFDSSVESYDANAGTPAGVSTQGKPQDYAANPVNPPEKQAPAKNLKR